MARWELTQHYETPRGIVRWHSFGQGSPVVLLHGTPFSSYVWRDIAAALSRRHTVFVWDLLGYGQSQMLLDQDVSLAAQQAVFTELLGYWGLERPAVVAHDFGGAVALRSALLDGVAYERLALLDAVSLRPWGSDFFRVARENAAVFTALPAHIHEALVRSYISTASRPGLREDVTSALVAPWLGPEGQPAFYRQLSQADERFTREVEERYGDLDMPVLVAWGSQDQWLPLDHATRLARQIPGARLSWIEGAGHLVQEDAPAQVTATLCDFLDHA
ncbi:alpha/beta fold hydrolase [Salinactinospora qingdaonensis]|uniref:Alpha/beta hydrolase n=1 Tax=Salinactinospora qingdaonensis TaxID=702744 RepID=A0ABP7GHE1_9ACTN